MLGGWKRLGPEVAIPKTSTPFVVEGNALAPVRGEDASGVASSSIGPIKEIDRVARVLVDWSSDVNASCFTFFFWFMCNC